ncbi:glycosyltransferase family 4 protein [Aquihabitans daechungensis]|uniref:glycosyltransferase family 4 protein n=1 Tax=Aquihabitans daechungensis TaxID=1052257 RepID=UPI003BA00B7C
MIVAPRVLLVGHDASTTGVPVSALAWARWAARTGAAEVEVHLDRGGPLVDGFAAVAPTRVRSSSGRRLVTAADAAAGAAGSRRIRRVAAFPARRGVHAEATVVAASVAAWRSAAALARPGRLVLWLHELDGVADRVVAPDERPALLAATRSIVAVSDRVAEMVVERWGVEPERVSVVGSFTDPPTDAAAPDGGPPRPDVLAVGSLVPRKGAEHVVALVALLARDRAGLRAAWVGGDRSGPYADLIRTDVTAAGLGAVLTLPGEVADVEPWWPTAGVVVHLAREDPAPLVALEAGLRAIPVVTWDTGGAADLLRRAGLDDLVAAPGDLVAVADAVARLLDDGSARAAAGAALRTAAAERTTERLAPALLDAILGGTT